MPDVTFETKCYERDWEILLRTNRLEAMIKRNCFDFAERILYINNVSDIEKVKFHAQALKRKGVITDYIFVDDYAEEALEYFGLDRNSFKGGYYYSIQELVGIYRCRTEYLLHFAGDSILDGSFPWIEKAVAKIEQDPRVKVVNCIGFDRLYEVEARSYEDDDDFWLGYGFSDQNYLIRTSDFRAKIYHESHPLSERFPKYGGDLFEKRVDSWMLNHDYLRATYKHGRYCHQNFSRSRLTRTLKRVLGHYDC